MGVVRNRRHRIRVVDLHGGRGQLLGHSLYRLHGLRHADRLVEGRRLSGDFSTYTLVAANDDLPGGCGPGAYYASGMWSGCLEEGETYLIQVDGWQDARGQAGILIQSTLRGRRSPPAKADSIAPSARRRTRTEPSCSMWETGGDYTATWVGPNGFTASGQQISGLGSGTYSAAIVTSCGNTLTHTVTLTEPDPSCSTSNWSSLDAQELPNGEAFLGALGGTEPYEIVWSGEFGELGSGPLIEALGKGSTPSCSRTAMAVRPICPSA